MNTLKMWLFAVSAALAARLLWEHRKRMVTWAGISFSILGIALTALGMWLLQKEGLYCISM